MAYKVNDLVYFEGDWQKGVGKIVAISGNSFLVHSTQIASGHDGTPFVEKQDNKNNWFFIKEYLKPFTKKEGQKYKVLRNDHHNFREGDIISLTKLFRDGISTYKNGDKECRIYDINHPKCELEFYEDVEEHKENGMFTKDDLKVGYLVKLRNEQIAHVVNTQEKGLGLNFENAWDTLRDYSNDLTNETASGFDVDEVYGLTKEGMNAHMFTVSGRKLLWKREEVKEMTIEDIQKALGHKIKVVE